MAIINGKKVVNLPDAVTGRELKEAVNETRPNRRVLVKRPEGNVTIRENQMVRLNRNDKVKILPDRVKASEYSYNATKSDLQKKLIFSQVIDLEKKMFKKDIEIDLNFNWIVINNFRLPKAWAEVNSFKETKLMIIIPDQFPDLPPNGFYLPKTTVAPSGDSHFFDRGYGGAYGEESNQIQELKEKGWKWYCAHIKPEAWSPARIRTVDDWRNGDNLWEVINVITDVLTDPYGD